MAYVTGLLAGETFILASGCHCSRLLASRQAARDFTMRMGSALELAFKGGTA